MDPIFYNFQEYKLNPYTNLTIQFDFQDNSFLCYQQDYNFVYNFGTLSCLQIQTSLSIDLEILEYLCLQIQIHNYNNRHQVNDTMKYILCNYRFRLKDSTHIDLSLKYLHTFD